MGTNHYSVEPTLFYYQRLNRRLAISGQFGDWHPIGGSAGIPTNTTAGGFAGDILNYGAGAAYDVLINENLRCDAGGGVCRLERSEWLRY